MASGGGLFAIRRKVGEQLLALAEIRQRSGCVRHEVVHEIVRGIAVAVDRFRFGLDQQLAAVENLDLAGQAIKRGADRLGLHMVREQGGPLPRRARGRPRASRTARSAGGRG